jgi:hypothetical protein
MHIYIYASMHAHLACPILHFSYLYTHSVSWPSSCIYLSFSLHYTLFLLSRALLLLVGLWGHLASRAVVALVEGLVV